MIKRRSNLSSFLRCGLLFIVLLAIILPGCKKETPPLRPPQTKPLPPKTQQGAGVNAVVPIKPLQPALSSARKSAAKSLVQSQVSTSKRLKPAGSVDLDFTSRRDPFKPFAQAPTPQSASAGKSGKIRIKDQLPIQSFDTEKFKVSGIVTGLKANSALVIDPSGKGYVVKEGMQIGNNDGYVKKITDTVVEVEESFRDDNGRVRKRLVKLMLLRKK